MTYGEALGVDAETGRSIRQGHVRQVAGSGACRTSHMRAQGQHTCLQSVKHRASQPVLGHRLLQATRTAKVFRIPPLHRIPRGLAPPRTRRLGRPTIPAGEERPERSQIDSCSTERGCEAPFPKGHISHVVSGFHTFLSKGTTAVGVSKTGFKREKTAGKSDSPYTSGFFSRPTHTHTHPNPTIPRDSGWSRRGPGGLEDPWGRRLILHVLYS